MTFLSYMLIAVSISLSVALGPFPSTVPHTVKPRLKSLRNQYTPTNSWYQNWLLNKGEATIQTYPYQIQARAEGLCISYSGKNKMQ
jgi:hypothetical protein